jgi:hypothetical protein
VEPELEESLSTSKYLFVDYYNNNCNKINCILFKKNRVTGLEKTVKLNRNKTIVIFVLTSNLVGSTS